MTPFFSVIVPIYNVEKYLDRCLDSLVKQTFPDFEAVLVDDGSKDGSNAIARSWLAKDGRFRMVEKENAGLGYARNTGLDNASGQFTVFLDSDDYLVPDALERIHNRLTQTGADVCYYGLVESRESGMVYPKPPQKLEYTENERDEFLLNILGPVPESKETLFAGVSACGSSVRRSILEENHIRFPSERECICEDQYYSLQMCMKVKHMAIEPSCPYVYCFNGAGSLTTRYRKDRFEAVLRLSGLFAELMEQSGYTDRETKQRLQRSLMQNLIVCLRQEAQHFKKNGLFSALKRVGEICRHPQVQAVLRSYPVDRMPKSQRVLFTAMKWKLTPVVFALTWLRYGRRVG